MGSLVKKVGKVVKKVGKFVKKVAPYAIMAAAIYFGVGAYGASLMGGSASAGSMAAFKTGLSGIGAKFGMNTAMAGKVTPFSWVKGIKGFTTGGASTPIESVAKAADLSAFGGAGAPVQGASTGLTGVTKAWEGAKNATSNFFGGMGDLGKAATIQVGGQLAAAGVAALAPAEESAFDERRKAMEIGVGGQVVNSKGDVRPANMANPNDMVARVDQTYNANQQRTQGLVMAKPQAELTAGPSPNQVGLLRRAV